MAWLKNVALLAVVVAAGLVLSPSAANAGFLPAFTGNTVMFDTPGRSGVVSFAVYQNTGGNWATQLGLSPSFLSGSDTSAAYVYMYEVVNVSNANGKIDNFRVSDYGLYTSAGYFTDRVFSDLGPNTTTSGRVEGTAGDGNYALGTPNPPANTKADDDTVDGVPTRAGVVITSINIVADPDTSNTIEPGSVNQSLPGFITFNFPTSIGKLQGGNSNQWSSIVFLTSNVAPTYWAGRVTDGVGDYSDGDVPVAPTPEPGTLLMSVIGVVGLSGFYGWRRWRLRPAAVPA